MPFKQHPSLQKNSSQALNTQSNYGSFLSECSVGSTEHTPKELQQRVSKHSVGLHEECKILKLEVHVPLSKKFKKKKVEKIKIL